MEKYLNQDIFMGMMQIAFAQISVKRHIDEYRVLIISPKYVKDVEMSILQTSTKKQNTVKIVKIEEDIHADVYNMEVDDNHNFAINGGLIVHNCMDDTRYFVKTMKIATPRQPYISIM